MRDLGFGFSGTHKLPRTSQRQGFAWKRSSVVAHLAESSTYAPPARSAPHGRWPMSKPRSALAFRRLPRG